MKTHPKEIQRWRMVESLGVRLSGLPLAGSEYYHLMETAHKFAGPKWRKTDDLGTLARKGPKKH